MVFDMLSLFTGAFLTLLGSLVQYYIGSWSERRKAITSLIEELNDNINILRKLRNMLKSGSRGILPLYTESYVQARNTGALQKMNKEIRAKLHKIYVNLEVLNRIAMASIFGLTSPKDPEEFSKHISALIKDMENVKNAIRMN